VSPPLTWQAPPVTTRFALPLLLPPPCPPPSASQVYIDTILQHHSLRQLVLEVHTNPAEWRGGALRVAPLHGAHPHPPHGCPHCPTNLCKGKVRLPWHQLAMRRQGRQWNC
jgi:hypothetical protein